MLPDFTRPPWSLLTPAERAAAIAAAGVLTRHDGGAFLKQVFGERGRRLREDPIPFYELIARLLEAAITRGRLSWSEPRILNAVEEPPLLVVLAVAWRAFARVSRWRELRLEGAFTEDFSSWGGADT